MGEIEDLWNAIVDFVGGWFRWIWDAMWSWLDPVLDALDHEIWKMQQWLYLEFYSLVGDIVDPIKAWVLTWINVLDIVIGLVEDNLTTAISGIGGTFQAAIDPVEDLVTATGTFIVGSISLYLDTWGATLQAGMTVVNQSVGIAVSGLEAAWNVSVGGILEGIPPLLEEVAKKVLGLVTAQVKTFPTFFLSLIEHSVVDDLMGKGGVIFDRLFSGITGMLWSLLDGLFPKTPTKPEDAENVVKHIMTLMLGGTASIGGAIMLGELVHPFKELGLKYVSAMMFKIADFQSIGSAITLSFATPAFIIPLQRAMNVRYQPSLPGIEDLIKFLVREQITPAEFDATMLYHGFSQYWSGKYWGAHWILPGLTLSREMVNRELINELEYKELLTLNDMMPEWIDRVAATRWKIPGVTDAVRFAVREVWVEEGKETVAEFRKHMKSLGYDPIWADRYWQAHWELVPITRLYEMFYRKIITKDELRAELVKHDYRPEWVDRIVDVSYRMIPIIYLRRAWELGVLSDERLVEELLKHGYDPDIIEELAAIVKRMALENEVAEVRREEIAQFQEGFSSVEELRAKITVLGYKDVVVNYFVRKAELRLERVERKEQKKVLIHSYRKDIIEVDEFRAELLLLGLQPEFTERLIVLEAIRKTKGVEELMVELIGE